MTVVLNVILFHFHGRSRQLTQKSAPFFTLTVWNPACLNYRGHWYRGIEPWFPAYKPESCSLRCHRTLILEVGLVKYLVLTIGTKDTTLCVLREIPGRLALMRYPWQLLLRLFTLAETLGFVKRNTIKQQGCTYYVWHTNWSRDLLEIGFLRKTGF